MASLKKLFRAALLAGTMVSAASCFDSVEPIDNNGDDRLLSEVFNKAVRYHVSQPHPDTLKNKNIEDMLTALDPHSAYLTPEEYQLMRQDMMRGEFGGVGIEVIEDEATHLIRVISPIDNTPAARGGILPGDIITHLDGQPLEGTGLSETVSRLRGAPGTSVRLTVAREGAAAPIEISLTRSVIKVVSVKGAVIDDDIGYVRISSFNEHTESSLMAVMEQLKADLGGNARGYVIDLRNNPGGLLQQGVSVADSFLHRGTIVSVGGSNGRNQVYHAYQGDISGDKPIIILMNEGSASAAEIVAGALQDHGRAIILGTRSFGKGSVQTVMPLSNGGALSLTTAHYYTPSGDSIQGRGITPDIRFVADEAGEIRREADLENALGNPNRASDERLTKETCRAAANRAVSIDAAALRADGKPDYQLLCAVDKLRGTSSYTFTAPVLSQ